MKHFKTIVNGKEPAPVMNPKDISYATSCKTSVTLGTNFNTEKNPSKE